MPSDPFQTLEGRLDPLTRAVENLTAMLARTGSSFNASQAFKQDISGAVAEGVNQAQATGARTQTFGHPLPTLFGALPSAPMPSAHKYNYTGKGHQAVFGVLGGSLRSKAADRISNIPDITRINVNAGERLGPAISLDDGQGGTETYHEVQDAYGQSIPGRGLVSAAEASSWANQIQRVHNTTGLGATVLQGIGAGEGVQGILSGIGSGAASIAKFAPMAAAAYGAVEAGAKLAKVPAEVRSQLANYQQIYGGSALSQTGKLVGQGLFSASEMFDLGGQAGALYQGTASLGLGGQTQQNALNFGINMYNKYGMSIANTLKLVQVAAANGNRELTGLATAIATVTSAAKNGGVPTGVAQQNFISNLTQAATVAGVNPGTQAVSASLASAQAGLGLAGQNLNFSGLLSYNTAAQVGGQYGKTPEAVLAEMNSPGTGAQTFNSQLQGTIWARLQAPMQPYMPWVTALVKQLSAAGVKASDMKNSNYLQGLVNQIMADDGSKGGGWMSAVSALASSLGITGDNYSQATWAVGVAVGQVAQNLGFNLNASGQSLAAQPVSKSVLSQLQSLSNGGLSNPSKATVSELNAIGISGNGIQAGVEIGNGAYNSSQKAYISYLAQTGKTNPVLEDALKSKTLSKSQYVVTTPGGGTKTVSLAELISQYPDQADTARIVKGPKGNSYAGDTLDQATGATSTTGAPGSANNKKLGTIVIALTPQAAQVLTATSPDGLSLATTNAQNLPASQYPAVPYTAIPGSGSS